jgi:hypothetical protein
VKDRWTRFVGVLLIAMVVTGVATARADARRPELQDLTVSPWPIPAAGGPVTVRFHVRYASTCRLVSLGLAPFRCSGWTSVSVNWPANQSQSETASDLVIHAQGPHGRTSATLVINQGGVSPPVVNLYTCTPGPECDYGPIYDTFQTYGNTTTLGDCTFAAAADWEQIFLGERPEPEQIAYQFGTAGGTEAGGLSQTAFMDYWVKYGIGGVKVAGFERFTTTPADVRTAVGDYSVLIVELDFVEGTYFGTERMTAGMHEVVVDGYTPGGPLVVTWGKTVQMTWEQWQDEVVGMWGVGAASAA